MYIFFYLSIILFIVGLVLFIAGLRKETQDFCTLQKHKQDELEKELKGLIDACRDCTTDKKQLEVERDALVRERNIEQERLNDLKKQSRELLITERERLEAELELTKRLKTQKLEQSYKEREQILESNFQTRAADIETELQSYQNQLQQFRDMSEAVNEAIRRKKELEEQEYFYSIDVSENDQEDISILQSMDARLHNRDVIPKLVWELFIRRPTQEMIKRVTGGKDGSGIYKITYKKTGEAYIGKTTSFSTRWQNHIKTAIGLEAAARATLHNRMAKDGLWNYTFEILERVDKEHLSTREAYYIDLYGTKNQLNMKSGDKNGTQ